MCKVQMLRALVKQRLTAAAEEIFGLFERTIAEYEEELSRSKEENERQRKLLDAVLNSHQLQTADVQQPSVVKDEVPPEHQECSSSVDQEEPEPPHIKEEEEELWISQQGEQLQGLEEADITQFTFTPVPVKSEDDEENPSSSELYQRQSEQVETKAGEEDCGGPETARNSDPDSHLQPISEDDSLDSSETDTDDCADWREAREPQSGLKSLNNDEVPVSESRYSAGKKPFSCSVCGKCFTGSKNLRNHTKIHTGEKPFSCSVCKKSFTQRGNLRLHMKIHTGEKPFSCPVCQKSFTQNGNLQLHMKIHTGEKPFSCSVCQKSFTQNGNLQLHMRIHTGERPYNCLVCSKRFSRKDHLVYHMSIHTGETAFSCPICNKSFTQSGNFNLQLHMKTHTGEKPFSCSVCGKGFTEAGSLKKHMRIHTGEKPFSCSVCQKSFTQGGSLRLHMKIHTGEKPFSCSVCGKAFTESGSLKKHMRIHTGEKPFSCSVCGKRFIQKVQLTQHMTHHTPVTVKSEDDEEKPQCSQFNQRQAEQMETEVDGGDCGGPEPAGNSHPDTHLQPDTDEKAGDSAEPETEVRGDFKETGETQPGLNSV